MSARLYDWQGCLVPYTTRPFFSKPPMRQNKKESNFKLPKHTCVILMNRGQSWSSDVTNVAQPHSTAVIDAVRWKKLLKCTARHYVRPNIGQSRRLDEARRGRMPLGFATPIQQHLEPHFIAIGLLLKDMVYPCRKINFDNNLAINSVLLL